MCLSGEDDRTMVVRSELSQAVGIINLPQRSVRVWFPPEQSLHQCRFVVNTATGDSFQVYTYANGRQHSVALVQ